jgi:hypothetical protein
MLYAKIKKEAVSKVFNCLYFDFAQYDNKLIFSCQAERSRSLNRLLRHPPKYFCYNFRTLQTYLPQQGNETPVFNFTDFHDISLHIKSHTPCVDTGWQRFPVKSTIPGI